jgi:hypothetical protein
MVSVHFWTMSSWSHSCLHVSVLFGYPRVSCSIASMIDSLWKFLPRWVMLSSSLEFEKVPFLFWAFTRVTGPRRSRNEAPKQAESWSTVWFYKVLCHPCVERKVAWEIEKFSSFQRTQYPPLSMVNALFIISCTHLSFVNLKMRFLLRGEGCNTTRYNSPNYFH